MLFPQRAMTEILYNDQLVGCIDSQTTLAPSVVLYFSEAYPLQYPVYTTSSF